MKTDNKVVPVEKEEESDPEVEMVVRRWTKEENKLVMRCFYQSDPTRRGYRKRMIAIQREIGTFEITEQRLVHQARVIRTNEWLTEVELEEIKRKILTHRDGEENQEINDIPVIDKKIQNESCPMEPSETVIRVRVETKITDEERLITDELKALMIRNETEEYLHFKKVDQRKLRDVTKKLNAMIRHIETDVTQTTKLAMAAAHWIAKEVGVKKSKIGEKKEPWWKRRIEGDITNLRRDINRLERERPGETKEKD